MPTVRFPLVKNPDLSGYGEGLSKPTKKALYENNTESIRPGSSISRRTFTCGWRSLTNDEKESLQDFFSKYNGYAFEFLPPMSSTPVLVRFSDDELAFSARTSGWNDRTGMRWSVSVRFIEMTDNPILRNSAEEATAL